MSGEALRRVRDARSGANCNFWRGGTTSGRQNIGRWTTENAPRVHERCGHRCALCGSNRDLEAHHIDPVWHHPTHARDLDNLVSLCVPCHRRLHLDHLELTFLSEHKAGTLGGFWERHDVAGPWPAKKRKPPVRKLRRAWARVANVQYVGEEMTYDLSVAGPCHNFVANGFIVHNSINEYSARYSIVQERFYKPERADLRAQSGSNRQGRGELLDDATADAFLEHLSAIEREQYAAYERFLEQGVARETARMALPQNVFTEWYWKCDLHNIFRFLQLRLDEHAQKEIRDYAAAMYALIRPIVPVAAEAFEDYQLRGMHLTRLEIEALRSGQPLASDNKRENAEWEVKRKALRDA